MKLKSEPEFTELHDRLRKRGLRFTAQRKAVWRLFRNSPRGLTISEAVDVLKEQGIGFATVYRTVNALRDMGCLQWVHGQDGEHRFVTWRTGHVHPLVCRQCGRVVEIESCHLDVLERLLAVETGFVIEGHHLEVFGLCPTCK